MSIKDSRQYEVYFGIVRWFEGLNPGTENKDGNVENQLVNLLAK